MPKQQEAEVGDSHSLERKDGWTLADMKRREESNRNLAFYFLNYFYF